MAIKKRVARRPGIGSATVVSPSVLAMLADPGRIETTVRLRIVIGDPLFDGLNEEVEKDVESAVEILRNLWPKHAAAATEYCLREHGAGVRPALWWERDAPAPRPHVEPRNWALDGDRERFERERAASDLAFLEKHKLLTREELRMLADAK